MKTQSIFDLASRLRDAGNAYIVSELEQAGLTDIAPSHGIVLQQLFASGPLNMSDLARNARRSKSTLTVLVAKLEKAGYVERMPDSEDSRGIKVRLTQKGLGLKPAFHSISEGLQNIILKNLTEEEATRLEELLAKCLAS